MCSQTCHTKGHFIHETESPWPLLSKVELVQVRFTLCLRDHRSMWMQDGCKVHMDSYMASDGSYFKVTWPTFKNHLLEVGITQNRTTLTPDAQQHRWFILLYHVQKPTWIEIYRNSIWLRARYIWLHTTLEGPWPHCMIWEVGWDGLWTLSFELPQCLGHGSWLVCEVALRATSHTRLTTRDHYTSNTLIGGNGGASTSPLHTMLEGPT